MLAGGLQFQRLDIEQEKTDLCSPFSAFLLRGGSAQESSCLCSRKHTLHIGFPIAHGYTENPWVATRLPVMLTGHTFILILNWD